jgi:hypothetical protein
MLGIMDKCRVRLGGSLFFKMLDLKLSFMMQHMLRVVSIYYVVNIYYLRSAAY